MARKIFSGFLIGLGTLFLVLSISALALVWMYKDPLEQSILARLSAVDSEMALAQTALVDAKSELERTLRLVDSAQQSLDALKEQLSQAQVLFGTVDETLDKQLIPSLQASRSQVDEIKKLLTDLRASVAQLNALPFIEFKLPGDEVLAGLIGIADSIDGEIARVQSLAEAASTFTGDMSYLMGGDLGETRQSLENFLKVVNDYDQKVAEWRAQIANLSASLPGWLDTAAILLTILLAWFAFSQVSLVLHSFSVWRGDDVSLGLREALKKLSALWKK
jgi:hypothetical protein